jgi:RNA-splicing ligase RtcB
MSSRGSETPSPSTRRRTVPVASTRGRQLVKAFTASDLRTAIEGIEYRDTDAFIDEIPAAYKPLDQVMADAASLVRVRHTLRQLVKGD